MEPQALALCGGGPFRQLRDHQPGMYWTVDLDSSSPGTRGGLEQKCCLGSMVAARHLAGLAAARGGGSGPAQLLQLQEGWRGGALL